jgi:hypothetical protein
MGKEEVGYSCRHRTFSTAAFVEEWIIIVKKLYPFCDFLE